MLLKQLFLFLKPITVITVDPSCLLVLLELCQNVCIITLRFCKVAEGIHFWLCEHATMLYESFELNSYFTMSNTDQLGYVQCTSAFLAIAQCHVPLFAVKVLPVQCLFR